MSHGYQEFLSFRWAGRAKPAIPFSVRAGVLRRANGCCENCGVKTTLELHHLHYETEGKESPQDLVAICRACHLNAHVAPNGVFYVDPQERAVDWATYGEQD